MTVAMMVSAATNASAETVSAAETHYSEPFTLAAIDAGVNEGQAEVTP
jgi:hypothetical protein